MLHVKRLIYIQYAQLDAQMRRLSQVLSGYLSIV